jgi:hypothetical protein
LLSGRWRRLVKQGVGPAVPVLKAETAFAAPPARAGFDQRAYG